MITHNNMTGKKISRALFECKWHNVNIKCPDNMKLFNFKFHINKNEFVMLDNYGDEVIPADLYKKILGHELFSSNLIICKKTGAVYLGTFDKEKSKYSLLIHSLPNDFVVPKTHLKKLDELLNMKRPYAFDCNKWALWNFIDKEEGFRYLRENLVVRLHFPNNDIECDYRGFES